MIKKINILENEVSFNKFCAKEDKVFGCSDEFGCRIACPLYRAKMVQYLVNEKGMTIGDAHRASLRSFLDNKETRSALKRMFENGKECISMKELLSIIENKK